MTGIFLLWVYESIQTLSNNNLYLAERIAVLEDREHREDFVKNLFTMAYASHSEPEAAPEPEEDTTTIEVNLEAK
jgi:hypothetical protein